MLVGLVTFELHLPHAHSLKDKRRVVKSLVERLHHRFRISVLESDHHDLHQRSEISLAVLGLTESEIGHMLDELRRIVDGQGEAEVTVWNERILEGVD